MNKQFYIDKIKEINVDFELKTGRKKRFFLQTFGCQMNENDSERLAGMLYEMGYNEAGKQEKSDIIIYNTCCVRENAEFRVYGHLGALKKLKRENPGMIIAVCGCMMQQEHVVQQVKDKYRHVDLVFGTHNIFSFPELLFKVINTGTHIFDVSEETANTACERPADYGNIPLRRKGRVSAFITIMHGCDNYCSYCIVPYVRGRERSRPAGDIIGEAKQIAGQGFKEITLLGQNVNSYGKDLLRPMAEKAPADKPAGVPGAIPTGMPAGVPGAVSTGVPGFAGLLYELNKVDGIERIRFMTSHPKDLSDDLILAMSSLNKVCPHLHLPVQSGSNRILKEMNRGYDREYYMELIKKIRDKIPGIALTTDLIVGFPGETDDDFGDTIDLLEKIKFDFAFTFLYSKRKGTPAAEKAEQVDEEIKKNRFGMLTEVQNRISKQINEGLLGKEMEILVEGLSRNSIRTYTGRTPTNKIVNFRADSELTGRLVYVRIEKIQTWSLQGSIIE